MAKKKPYSTALSISKKTSNVVAAKLQQKFLRIVTDDFVMCLEN